MHRECLTVATAILAHFLCLAQKVFLRPPPRDRVVAQFEIDSINECVLEED